MSKLYLVIGEYEESKQIVINEYVEATSKEEAVKDIRNTYGSLARGLSFRVIIRDCGDVVEYYVA